MMLDNIQIMGKITLKELRRLTGLSQQEFAERVGIPFTTYRRYERNPANMDAGKLFHICDVVGISIESIRLA